MQMPGRRRGKTAALTRWDRRRIREARERAGMTHGDLGRRVSLSGQSVKRLEDGVVTVTTVALLSDLYRILRLPAELIGQPDPDEEQLVSAYDRAKRALPNRAPELLAAVKRWADRFEHIRTERERAETDERHLLDELGAAKK